MNTGDTNTKAGAISTPKDCPWAHCGRIWAHRVTVHRRGALYVLQSVV